MPTVLQVARISLKNILLPIDFSPASHASLPFALSLARVFGSKLLIMHSLPAEPHLQVPLDRLPAQDDRPGLVARQKLAEFSHDPTMAETSCATLVERGDLSQVIPAMIREHEVDLIVLSTHGRRGVSKVMLGSAAEKIYRSASCPVLTIGPKVAPGEWRLRRILCPIDIEAYCESALHYALSLAEENAAEFTVMEAVPMVPWQHRASVEIETHRRIESLIPEQAKDWCTLHYLVRWEHPAEAILRAASEREADLIVMGVRRAKEATFSSHLPWPIASEVVSRASCPVLTVRV